MSTAKDLPAITPPYVNTFYHVIIHVKEEKLKINEIRTILLISQNFIFYCDLPSLLYMLVY